MTWAERSLRETCRDPGGDATRDVRINARDVRINARDVRINARDVRINARDVRINDTWEHENVVQTMNARSSQLASRHNTRDGRNTGMHRRRQRQQGARVAVYTSSGTARRKRMSVEASMLRAPPVVDMAGSRVVSMFSQAAYRHTPDHITHKLAGRHSVNPQPSITATAIIKCKHNGMQAKHQADVWNDIAASIRDGHLASSCFS